VQRERLDSPQKKQFNAEAQRRGEKKSTDFTDSRRIQKRLDTDFQDFCSDQEDGETQVRFATARLQVKVRLETAPTDSTVSLTNADFQDASDLAF
jgi:hypothetical protein